tara:strand:- start:30764 stop:31264 length:501 start_codon:yes stop_codon:yes gene_type:complete
LNTTFKKCGIKNKKMMTKFDTFVNRDYKITMTFNMSGDVPPRFTEEQFRDKIESFFSELEIDSEVFDGETEHYFWTLSLDGDIKIDIKGYEVEFVEEFDCEHCGSYTDYFGPMVTLTDSGTTWCESCADTWLSENQKEFIEKERKKFKKKLIKKKIESLREDLKNL